jgi:hypothetical protein
VLDVPAALGGAEGAAVALVTPLLPLQHLHALLLFLRAHHPPREQQLHPKKLHLVVACFEAGLPNAPFYLSSA